MDINFIVYPRGAGGNFLCRILTLDCCTVYMGPYVGEITTEERFVRYNYSADKFDFKFNKFNENGLSEWVSKELNEIFYPFTLGLEQLTELDKKIIQPCHPQYLADMQSLCGPDDTIKYYFIDISNCIDWVVDQVIHKGAHSERNPSIADLYSSTLKEYQDIIDLANYYEFTPIKLHNIINSEESFLVEYIKICKNINITPYIETALKIYRSWKHTWKNE